MLFATIIFPLSTRPYFVFVPPRSITAIIFCLQNELFFFSYGKYNGFVYDFFCDILTYMVYFNWYKIIIYGIK